MRTRAQAITDRQVKPPMIVNKQPQLSYKRPQESQINIQDTNYGKYMVCVMLILAISMKLSLWETRVSHISGATHGHDPTYQKDVCHPSIDCGSLWGGFLRIRCPKRDQMTTKCLLLVHISICKSILKRNTPQKMHLFWIYHNDHN